MCGCEQGWCDGNCVCGCAHTRATAGERSLYATLKAESAQREADRWQGVVYRMATRYKADERVTSRVALGMGD